jgi:transposase-like protein
MIVAVAVHTDGRREVLGITIRNSEAEPFRTKFPPTMRARRS